MTDSAGLLTGLHHYHKRVADLRDRLNRGPKQIQARQAHLNLKNGERDAAKEKLQKTRLTVSEKELSLKERENRILDIRAKLNSCSTNKEYQALIEQIAADEQANSVLSDEILELLDKVEEDKEAVNVAAAAVQEAEEQLSTVTDKVEAQKGDLERDLADVEAKLKELESKLPQDVRGEYERVARAHGEDALAPLDGDVCGGCYQRVTPQMENELKLGRMVFCKSCGRMLYVAEDTSVQ